MRVSHLQFDSDGLSITIPRSKTDQLGRGETVYIQFAAHPACPVSLIQDYIDRLHYDDGQDGYIQPRVSSTNGDQHGIWNTTVSYSTALSDLKLLLTSLGYDASRFGEHSGRRGGATAASDAGVDWTDLMSHGRWKSVATPLGYLANLRRRQRRVAQALALTSSSDDAAPAAVSAPSSVALLDAPSSVALSDAPSSVEPSDAPSSVALSSAPSSVALPAAPSSVALSAAPSSVASTSSTVAIPASSSSRFNFRPLSTLAAYRAAAETAANQPISRLDYTVVPDSVPALSPRVRIRLCFPLALSTLFSKRIPLLTL